MDDVAPIVFARGLLQRAVGARDASDLPTLIASTDRSTGQLDPERVNSLASTFASLHEALFEQARMAAFTTGGVLHPSYSWAMRAASEASSGAALLKAANDGVAQGTGVMLQDGLRDTAKGARSLHDALDQLVKQLSIAEEQAARTRPGDAPVEVGAREEWPEL